MLRKLLILGICAGSSASVPILYQSNPDAFHHAFEQVAGSARPTETRDISVATVRPVRNEPAAPLGRKVRLPADSRGHFSAEFKMNGRKLDAMIDTGATLVAMNLSTARRIGLQIGPADFKYKVETANGETRAAAATIDSLQVGRIVVERVEAVILEDKALNGTLIGVSFLKRLSKYQVEDGALILTQ